jgi:hypothetical protein
MGDLGVDVRIILEQILRKQDMMVWTGVIWLGIKSNGGLREHGNDVSGPIQVRQFSDHPRDYNFVKKTIPQS